MRPETLAELVARTIIEFEKREAQLQRDSQMQQKNDKKPKNYKHKAA